MNIYQKFIHNVPLRRIVVLFSLVALIFLIKPFLSMILLTFIFSYLSVKIVRFVQKKSHSKIKPIWIIIPLYLLMIYAIYWGVHNLIPELAHQIPEISNKLMGTLKNFGISNVMVKDEVNNFIGSLNIEQTLKASLPTVYSFARYFAGMSMTFLFSIIFSFLYTSELEELNRFNRLFLSSKLDWYFQDVYYYGKKFVNSFGVVLETQILIAVINTALTLIALSIIHMPNLASLGIIIFVFSLIPVAGVIISFIPLALFGYLNGGINDVIYILVILIVIHLIETYLLNPKIMANRTQLPVFYTFVILIVADRLMGPWGLLVGVPIFSFILDILGVKEINGPLKTVKKKINLRSRKSTKK